MPDWENLRYFLAVARIGTLSGAARCLKVDHATVSRRLSALESEIDTRLIERQPKACTLTPIGQRVFELAQEMEEGAHAIERFLDASRSPLSGKVTLSAPPVLVANFLVKHLAVFRRANPGVQLSVSGDARRVSSAEGRRMSSCGWLDPKNPTALRESWGACRSVCTQARTIRICATRLRGSSLPTTPASRA